MGVSESRFVLAAVRRRRAGFVVVELQVIIEAQLGKAAQLGHNQLLAQVRGRGFDRCVVGIAGHEQRFAIDDQKSGERLWNREAIPTAQPPSAAGRDSERN